MPHVRYAHRGAAARPPVLNQAANRRAPMQRIPTPRAHAPQAPAPRQPNQGVRNRVPQYLPVLQPPTFPRETEFYEEEQHEQYQEEYYHYPTAALSDQQRAVKQHRLANRTRLITSLNRFSFQPFARFSNRYSRYF